MQIVANANDAILAILKKITMKSSTNRLSCYCVESMVEEGVLLFNLLTRELLLLTPEEYTNINQLDYLQDHWFLVPQDIKEKECADLIKCILANQKKKSNEITSYTIFTTTDCNARCFYCFELGCIRVPMTNHTALKVVDYIKAHCGGKPIRITWFGGEPLMNTGVIDTICDGLQREGITFDSRIISNGYLFDELMIQKAVANWNLYRVQISLDGTEQVYNKIKAYIHKGENAYQRVLNNIGMLLDASVQVVIRLNMDLYNAEDLLKLMDELASRFAEKKGLFVYAHHLFKNGISMAAMHSDEEWEKRDAAMRCLEEKILKFGFSAPSGISKNIPINKCMADSNNAVTILPGGDIGLCEQHTEKEVIGTVDSDVVDLATIASWKEKIPAIPECDSCFYYLDCIKLQKCSNDGMCYRQYREDRRRKVQRQMVNEYKKWRDHIDFDGEDMAEC